MSKIRCLMCVVIVVVVGGGGGDVNDDNDVDNNLYIFNKDFT